jgi:tight adherence protein B
MNLAILSILIFIVTLLLIISVFYFLVIAPSEKRKLRRRIDTVKMELATAGSADGETQLLRAEILSGIPFFHRLLLNIPGTAKLQLFLQQSAVDITAGMLLTLAFLSGWFVFLLCMLFGIATILALILGLLALFIPFLVVAIKRQQRFLRFEEIFPDAIDLLARAVRAGHAFTTGLDLIAKEMPSPVSDEFARTYSEQNLGLPLRDALGNMMRRVPLIDFRIFVTALMIQRDSGGNLAEILDNLSHVIRERFKLMRKIRVYTAQGRLTLYILVALPPLLGIIIYFLYPKYIGKLFTDPLGVRFLIAAIILQVVGYFVIRKITQPKF